MTKVNTQERDSLFVPSMHTSTIVCSALSPWSKTGAFYYPRWNNWWLWPRWWRSWWWWRWWWWQQRWRWHQPCKGILRAGGARRARCQELATFCPLCHRTGCWHHDHHHHHHGDDHQYYQCMSIVYLCHFLGCLVIKDVIIIIMRMTTVHLPYWDNLHHRKDFRNATYRPSFASRYKTGHRYYWFRYNCQNNLKWYWYSRFLGFGNFYQVQIKCNQGAPLSCRLYQKYPKKIKIHLVFVKNYERNVIKMHEPFSIKI